MKKKDVIIVGAGPVGLFAVHQLGIKGLNAVVIDNLDKIIFFRYLTKIGYFFKKKKINSILFAIKAFQRRFRPQLINGKIDFECLEIAKNLVKSGFN